MREIRLKGLDGEIMTITLKYGQRMGTGLLDKNGKEIYNGDILSYPENEQNIYEMQDIKKPVIFERGAFRVDVFEYFKKVLDDETALEGEIIGNIWDNPELLDLDKE